MCDFARARAQRPLFGHVLFTVPRRGRTAVEAVALTRGYAGARAARRHWQSPRATFRSPKNYICIKTKYNMMLI